MKRLYIAVSGSVRVCRVNKSVQTKVKWWAAQICSCLCVSHFRTQTYITEAVFNLRVHYSVWLFSLLSFQVLFCSFPFCLCRFLVITSCNPESFSRKQLDSCFCLKDKSSCFLLKLWGFISFSNCYFLMNESLVTERLVDKLENI